MFSSNQIFEITGDNIDEEALKKVVTALVEGFDFKPDCYLIDEENNLCFHSYMSSGSSATQIQKEEQNAEFLFQLIKLYQNMSAYKTALQKESRNYGGDGSSYPGWKIIVDNSQLHDIVKVSPFWCFYHK